MGKIKGIPERRHPHGATRQRYTEEVTDMVISIVYTEVARGVIIMYLDDRSDTDE